MVSSWNGHLACLLPNVVLLGLPSGCGSFLLFFPSLALPETLVRGCLYHRLIPYGCLSTGVQVGLIEVVLESQTVANIQKTVGGSARAAFNKKCLYQFLQNWNPDKTR